jgi:hypothetical protein
MTNSKLSNLHFFLPGHFKMKIKAFHEGSQSLISGKCPEL